MVKNITVANGRPKTFEEAKRIAKGLRAADPAVASYYLRGFERRHAIETAACEANVVKTS